jgi:hypothetical protein
MLQSGKCHTQPRRGVNYLHAGRNATPEIYPSQTYKRRVLALECPPPLHPYMKQGGRRETETSMLYIHHLEGRLGKR